MEDNKQNIPKVSSNENISIKVSLSGHEDTLFKINRNKPLRKLIDTFCEMKNLDCNQVRFFANDIRLYENSIPEQVELQDGDTIDVFSIQDGGKGCVTRTQ